MHHGKKYFRRISTRGLAEKQLLVRRSKGRTQAELVDHCRPGPAASISYRSASPCRAVLPLLRTDSPFRKVPPGPTNLKRVNQTANSVNHTFLPVVSDKDCDQRQSRNAIGRAPRDPAIAVTVTERAVRSSRGWPLSESITIDHYAVPDSIGGATAVVGPFDR